MNLFEMKKQHAFALNKADSILKAAESAGRELTEAEQMEVDTAMAATERLSPQIKKIERLNTLSKHIINGKLIPGGRGTAGNARTPDAPVVLSEDYYNEFFTWLGSRGQQMGAALYEGTGSAGGFAVPVIVDGQVVPLAPTEMGVRLIATVIPTSSDIKIPRGTAFGTAALKAESGAADNFFSEVDPVLDQFTLSAFMAGGIHTLSWELAQDVPLFQQFAITDLVLALQMLEEGLFVSGTGTGQAQGLIGNVGAGVTCATHAFADILDSTFDVMGTLNAIYHPGASWLMSRATSIGLRKAQKQANLYEPVFTRENGQDYLHGYPVHYSTSMPANGAAAKPILFGDFKSGYVIGDRGGSGINVKILDQPKASEGQLQLLAYRRFDGRVRRSEAIQTLAVT
jgi:HK97 family phage major capsid protein